MYRSDVYPLNTDLQAKTHEWRIPVDHVSVHCTLVTIATLDPEAQPKL